MVKPGKYSQRSQVESKRRLEGHAAERQGVWIFDICYMIICLWRYFCLFSTPISFIFLLSPRFFVLLFIIFSHFYYYYFGYKFFCSRFFFFIRRSIHVICYSMYHKLLLIAFYCCLHFIVVCILVKDRSYHHHSNFLHGSQSWGCC